MTPSDSIFNISLQTPNADITSDSANPPVRGEGNGNNYGGLSTRDILSIMAIFIAIVMIIAFLGTLFHYYKTKRTRRLMGLEP
jgi:hypothetical protein